MRSDKNKTSFFYVSNSKMFYVSRFGSPKKKNSQWDIKIMKFIYCLSRLKSEWPTWFSFHYPWNEISIVLKLRLPQASSRNILVSGHKKTKEIILALIQWKEMFVWFYWTWTFLRSKSEGTRKSNSGN